MRRGRRGGHGALEFGGSGEDSFVAVVVTKLTGALLFILLLVMVIMALLPKAIDSIGSASKEAGEKIEPVEIVTPERLPEAIAGRPYALALAATGGGGKIRWMIDGPIPEGLAFDPDRGLISGTPEAGIPAPVSLNVRASDGQRSDVRVLSMVVYQPDGPLTLPGKLEATLRLPRLPWRAWGELGFGFLVLMLVHMVAMNGVNAMQRQAKATAESRGASEPSARRFGVYRGIVRVASVTAAVTLAGWLWVHRADEGPGETRPDSRPEMIAGTLDDRPEVRR